MESIIQYDVASISKTVVLPVYEEQACSADAKIRSTPIQHSSGTSLTRLFKKITHVHASVQACGWPFLTSVQSRVHIRNVFYYKHSEYAHSPQYLQLLFKVVWAADKQFHIEPVVFRLNFWVLLFVTHICITAGMLELH